MIIFPENNKELLAYVAVVIVFFITTFAYVLLKKQEPADDLPKPPNYDKEALLDLMEKGECMGGTIGEGKFSVFVCKN